MLPCRILQAKALLLRFLELLFVDQMRHRLDVGHCQKVRILDLTTSSIPVNRCESTPCLPAPDLSFREILEPSEQSALFRLLHPVEKIPHLGPCLDSIISTFD